MTKQQAPHSPERCAGVPGHKKDAAAGEGNLSTTLSLPRGTQGIKLPLHAVIKKQRQATDFIVWNRDKLHTAAQHLKQVIKKLIQ